MTAALLSKIGPDATIYPSSIQIPTVPSDHVLVRVSYCGVNHLDLLIKQGKRIGPKQFPHILGSEIVGTIESGERVAVFPWMFCSKCNLCKSGNENICDQGGTIGRTTWGGYAQYVVVPIKNIIKIPESVSLASVCAVTLAGTTAYHLIHRAKIENGSTVLVTGSTGGVGLTVIQLLKRKSCIVLATTSSKEKIPLLQNHGVDFVIPTEQLVECVRGIYPQGVQYVIEIVGGSIWSKASEVIAKNGTMVYCATTLNEQGNLNIGSAFSRQVNIVGSYGGTRRDLSAVIQFIKNGTLKPIIDSVYSLENANDALIKIENKKSFGKILIKSFQ